VKVLVVGAGPAGLYLAYLLKRQDPRNEIRIVEQNPAGSTFGFGVVFSDRALDFLRDDDPVTHDLIVPAMERWSDLCLVHRGEKVVIDGIGFAAIGRLELLRLLQRRLASVEVVPEYGRALVDEAELPGYDLVVAADGANSVVRSGLAREFGTTIAPLSNRFAWYGTPRRFDTLTQTFVGNEWGSFNAHHYRYAPGMSTFIVECDPATWARAGFADMDEERTRAFCERVFAQALGGAPLIANKSIWRKFPQIANERWSVGNRVLVGDALRTAHFSIGSGTRLAFEDVIALARALREHGGSSADAIRNALRAYETARRPIVDKLVAAAKRSADWYEHFTEHMELDPWEMAWSYIQRSGRVDPARLEAVSPRFVASVRERGKRV